MKLRGILFAFSILSAFIGSSYAQDKILFEGKGFAGLIIGRSKVDDVIGKFGRPDEIENTKVEYSRNYIYSNIGLKFNFHGEKLNTIITLPNFSGKTSRGITLRSSLDDVRATYGFPVLAPGQTIRNAPVWSYPEHGVIFWLKRGWFFRRPVGIDRIVIYRSARK